MSTNGKRWWWVGTMAASIIAILAVLNFHSAFRSQVIKEGADSQSILDFKATTEKHIATSEVLIPRFLELENHLDAMDERWRATDARSIRNTENIDRLVTRMDYIISLLLDERKPLNPPRGPKP